MVNPYDMFKSIIPSRKLSRTRPKLSPPEEVGHTKDANNREIRLGGSFNFALFHKGGCNGSEVSACGHVSFTFGV
jgi:hypothetical protein